MKIDLFEFVMKCQRSKLKWYITCCKKLLCANKFLCFILFIQRGSRVLWMLKKPFWHHKASKCTEIKTVTHISNSELLITMEFFSIIITIMLSYYN